MDSVDNIAIPTPYSELNAARWLLQRKHERGFTCRRCGHGEYREVRHRGCTWECKACRHQETARAHTRIERSRIPILAWLLAVRAWSATSGGISIKELQWRAGLDSYNTAWLIVRRLRALMPEDDPLFLAVAGFGLSETLRAGLESLDK